MGKELDEDQSDRTAPFIQISEVNSKINSLGPVPVESYLSLFSDLLKRIIKIPDHPVNALDLACGKGDATLAIHPELAPGSKIITISEDRTLLNIFHKNLTSQQRQSIYPRKQNRTRLPFAAASFDIVWLSLASETVTPPLRRSLREAMKVLKPGGQLIVVLPIRQAFLDLTNTIADQMGMHFPPDLLRNLLGKTVSLPTKRDLPELAESVGGRNITLEEGSTSVVISPPFMRDSLLTKDLLPLWVDDDFDLCTHLCSTMDEFLHEPVEFEIKAAAVSMIKGE